MARDEIMHFSGMIVHPTDGKEHGRCNGHWNLTGPCRVDG